jgi:predicted RNA polymerase sigma factor
MATTAIIGSRWPRHHIRVGHHRVILAVWRIEQPRLITSLARMLRDVPLAEDLTQEALVAALERWPVTGVPEKPGAWLMATAKRRALDHVRRGPDARAQLC